MIQDEVLSSISAKVQNFAVIYCVDKEKVTEFNEVSREREREGERELVGGGGL